MRGLVSIPTGKRTTEVITLSHEQLQTLSTDIVVDPNPGTENLKLKDSVVRQQRCPGQQAFQDRHSATEYQQVMAVNGREKAQCQLQLVQKHEHGRGSALGCP
ncbi:hypothetical protein EMCRGX_G012546 [Ephydatia muelleri]